MRIKLMETDLAKIEVATEYENSAGEVSKIIRRDRACWCGRTTRIHTDAGWFGTFTHAHLMAGCFKSVFAS